MRVRRLAAFLPIPLIAFIGTTLTARADDGHAAAAVNPVMIAPFLLLLTAIAVMPFVNRIWWERYYPAVCMSLGGVTVLYYLFGLHNPSRILHSGVEYLSFIALIGSLFVVAGGIHLRIRGGSTPVSNLLLLSIGAVASNIIGTTGASMILIRPYLRANKHRLRGFHVVFFIFIVSNIGGALSPIGDPPLFLGYLKGVPFFWVFEYVWQIWLVAVAAVLLVFLALDHRSFREITAAGTRQGGDSELYEKGEVTGLHNLIFVVIIVLSVFIQHPMFLREALMLAAAAASYATTRSDIHRKNGFNFNPVREVAILFLGIFATMVPALDWLELNAAQIGVATPGQFYWGTGLLSSVLDNAPTYLNFLSASIGLFVDQNLVSQVQHLVSTRGADLASAAGPHAEEIRNTFSVLVKYHSDLVATGTVPIDHIKICYLIGNQSLFLKAISIGAVFFGAVTYIGNGPNFMVKSIADQEGAGCPSFAGYLIRYSVPVLIPLFTLIWLLFFRT